MKYKSFGKTGEKVSALGFGCMRFPFLDGNPTRIDEDQAIPMLRHAIDRGLNYVDTAYPYHSLSFSEPGFSEPFVGRALGDGYREKVHLATKLPCWLVQDRSDMERLLDQQLERLQTDVIDFYLLHSLNQHTWAKMEKMGALDFLDKALADGKIRHAGFSYHDHLDHFRPIVDAYDWSFTQIMYNYYDEHFQAGLEGMRYASGRGLGIVVMEPLRGGALVGGLPEKAREEFKLSHPDWSFVRWALAWLWQQKEVDVVLSGMSDMAQVKENLDLADLIPGAVWTADDAAAVEQVKSIIRELQRVPCTACAYCMPCPEGVDIPRNFGFSNDHHMLNDPSAKMRYRNLLSEQQKASACIQCGECEEKCPQQIPIREELGHVVSIFEH